MKTALITGIAGQDGAYLAEFLLKKGYRVCGAHRRTSLPNFWRLEELGVLNEPQISLCEFDVTDLSSCIRTTETAMPDEVYNLAAQSFVGSSFFQPLFTANSTGLGVLNMLEGRFQASSATVE